MELFAPVVSITLTARRRFFWAAWWTSPPVRAPFLKPDASNGGARTLEEALGEASAVAGRSLVRIDPSWARAWSRVLRGQPPWQGERAASSARRPPPGPEPEPSTSPAPARSVLGLAPGATVEQVKRAYRAKALETHPDRGGDPEAFRRVQKAYEQALAKLARRGGAKKRRAPKG